MNVILRVDRGGGRGFQKLYKDIYLKKLVLKLEYSGSPTIFLDLDITISNVKISTKLYDKRDDFFILYACFQNNIVSPNFYVTFISKSLPITRSFSSVVSFYVKSSA